MLFLLPATSCGSKQLLRFWSKKDETMKTWLSKNWKWLLPAMVCVMVFVVFFFGKRSKDLKTELSEVFQCDKESLFLNLPAADGRYPGAVLVFPDGRQAFPSIRSYRPDKIPGVFQTATIQGSFQGSASFLSEVFGSISSSADVEVLLQLDSLRVFEMDLDSTAKAYCNENKDRLGKPASKPSLIVKAFEAMDHLVAHGLDVLTIGQYLQPTKLHIEVAELIHPDVFALYKEEGEKRGIKYVESGPLVRSSYHSERHVHV